MNRRQFLDRTIKGTSALVVTGCSAEGWSTNRDAGDTAFSPWEALETLQPYELANLPAAAILASNPHNTQPWTMTVDANRFQISADTSRHLGTFDPYRREMWIGLGCAIANAEMISAMTGYQTGSPVLSGLGRRGAGRISLSLKKVNPVEHPMGRAIQKRRTNRAPYRDQPIPSATLAHIAKMVGEIHGARFTTFDRGSVLGKRFAQSTLEATRAINADQQMSKDAHKWFRGTASMVAKYRDGVSIPTAGLAPAVSLLGQLLPEPDAQKSGEHWLSSTQRQLTQTGGFGLIEVSNLYNRHNQIAAGRLWQRLHLAFTVFGLAAQPINQLPELVDRDRSLGKNNGWLKKLSAISGRSGTTMMAFRFGYRTRNVPHSARRRLASVTSL